MANPAFITLYREWRSREDTNIVLDATRDAAVPAGLPAGKHTGEEALYYSGIIDGCSSVLNFLCNMEAVLVAAQQQDKFKDMQPDYGGSAMIAKGEVL